MALTTKSGLSEIPIPKLTEIDFFLKLLLFELNKVVNVEADIQHRFCSIVLLMTLEHNDLPLALSSTVNRLKHLIAIMA